MPDTPRETSPHHLSTALTAHAAVLWGEAKAAALQDSIAQTAQMLSDIAQRFPDGQVEPACYPAASREQEPTP